MSSHEAHTRRILDNVESGKPISQRSLARELGIALGLTNLLVRHMVRKGWIRLIRIKPNRVRYLITPAGLAEKTRVTRSYFASRVQFYVETRDRIRERFSQLSAACPSGGDNGGPGEKRIVFYGAGEVAEIAYVCLQDTDLHLVAVIDDHRTLPFFGVAVHSSDRLRGRAIDGRPFDRLVVMSFGERDEIAATLEAKGVPLSDVQWL